MSADQLQLVIPTFNRPDFLERALRYYSGQRVRFPIVVADSSPSPAADANRRVVEKLRPALTIRYERYASDIHIAQKIVRALEGVPSPYAALGADDDFSIPASLERGAEFLASHPDYVLAHGEAVLLTLTPAAAVDGRCAWVVRYPQRAVEGSTGAARLLDHLTRYSITFYSVHRTALLRQNWRTAAALELDDAFVELLPSCLSLIQGKSQKLEPLYMVRQGHSAQTSRTRDAGVGWILSQSWSEQYARFRDLLAEELAGQDRITMDVAREVVKQAFWPYVAREVERSCQSREGFAVRVEARLRSVARRMPLLRQGWRLARSIRPTSRTAISLEALLRRTSRYHEGFMPIYRAVTAQNGHGRA